MGKIVTTYCVLLKLCSMHSSVTFLQKSECVYVCFLKVWSVFFLIISRNLTTGHVFTVFTTQYGSKMFSSCVGSESGSLGPCTPLEMSRFSPYPSTPRLFPQRLNWFSTVRYYVSSYLLIVAVIKHCSKTTWREQDLFGLYF